MQLPECHSQAPVELQPLQCGANQPTGMVTFEPKRRRIAIVEAQPSAFGATPKPGRREQAQMGHVPCLSPTAPIQQCVEAPRVGRGYYEAAIRGHHSRQVSETSPRIEVVLDHLNRIDKVERTVVPRLVQRGAPPRGTHAGVGSERLDRYA
jgi:hypothetical protein